MNKVFIDVNIPMYAAGSLHPLREPSQQVIRAIASRKLDALTDVEVFQEILYRYFHIGEKEKGFKVFDLFHQIMLGSIVLIDVIDIQMARKLSEEYITLSPRDLIHLSVMIRHELKTIITTDKGFDHIKEVHRLDPKDIKQFLH